MKYTDFEFKSKSLNKLGNVKLCLHVKNFNYQREPDGLFIPLLSMGSRTNTFPQ